MHRRGTVRRCRSRGEAPRAPGERSGGALAAREPGPLGAALARRPGARTDPDRHPLELGCTLERSMIRNTIDPAGTGLAALGRRWRDGVDLPAEHGYLESA